MTVKLRFARAGRKKQPFYHIVAADERMPRNGRHLERLGYYNPMLKENRLTWNTERVNHWLETGAQPTTAVAKLVIAEKVGSDKIRNRLQAKIQERIDAVQARLAKAQAIKDAEAKAEADAAAAEKAEAEAAEKAAAAEAAAAEKPAEETATA